jgi:hypothetical protein
VFDDLRVIQRAHVHDGPNLHFSKDGMITAERVDQLEAASTLNERKQQPLNPRKRSRRDVSRTYACPCFKEDVLRERKLGCNGVSAMEMSAVRMHLNRPPHMLGVTQCKVCKEYNIGNTEHGPCTDVKPQPRGELTDKQWTSLFSKLYPESSYIPSPCECCLNLISVSNVNER